MAGFAVIGTSKITSDFITSAQNFENFSLEAVYSRSKEKGLAFAEKFSCRKVYTDMEELGRDDSIDAVYIASPNSFHCDHSIKMMDYGKHVLCEKPFASNSREVESMIKKAAEKKVLLMEAMKTPFMPVIQAIKTNLHRIGKIRRAYFNYSQYSSRYDNFRKGFIENTFKLEFSNGALVDIGIYPLFAMLYLFGKPGDISANAQFLETGVDGIGSISLRYDEMLGDIHYSKISNSTIPSEIQGEDGNIIVNGISVGASALMHLRSGKSIDLGTETKDSFHYEVKEFLRLLEDGKTESEIMSHALSLELMNALDEIRSRIGLVYQADKIK